MEYIEIKVGMKFGDGLVENIIKVGGQTRYEVRCMFCQTLRRLTRQPLLRDTNKCKCQRAARQKAAFMKKYGVSHPLQTEEVKAKALQTRLSRLTEKVGDVFNGRTLVRIETLPKLRYVVKCLICSAETKMPLCELRGKKGCRCQMSTSQLNSPEAQAKKVAGNKALAYNRLEEMPEGTELVKRGAKWLYAIPCTSCGEVREVTYSRAISGIGCRCQLGEKARATSLKKYGVEHHLKLDSQMEKSLNARSQAMKASNYRSKGEISLAAYVNSLGFDSRHYSSGRTELDVFVEECRIGIEYNGLYWHNEDHKAPGDHLAKKKHYAKENIDVIQIWEHQWETRGKQVRGYLRARLGKNEFKIGVRKCKVISINLKVAMEFMDLFHIQGANKSSTYAIGAYDGDKLVAVATFGKHHRGGGGIVLNRLCSKENWTCAGFLGKAIKEAYAYFKEPIVTWVDRCLSEGNSYIKAGFIQDAVLKPSYFYYRSSDKAVISKQSFRKIDSRTERERAEDEGLVRVYDCGKIRFVYGR